MADRLTIDVRDIKRFLRDLRASGLDSEVVMAKQFGTAFKAGGEIVARLARTNAAFSTRIPPTIKTRRAGPVVSVVAGGQSAPHARPIDHGGAPGTFRHPVFGNRNVWVDQRARPFLEPALAEGGPEAVKALQTELDRTYAKVWHRG